MNVRADMLSRIEAIQPAISAIWLACAATQPSSAPLPCEACPVDPPDVWHTDHIHPSELQELQREQFAVAYVEAQQASDGCRYVIQHGLIYTTAQPKNVLGRYLRLLLSQKYRQSVIDRCHTEIAHTFGFPTH